MQAFLRVGMRKGRSEDSSKRCADDMIGKIYIKISSVSWVDSRLHNVMWPVRMSAIEERIWLQKEGRSRLLG